MTHFTHGHALVIGAGGDLPITVEDAKGLSRILTDPERCAYPPAQMRLLTAENATRALILDGLETLRHLTGEDDTVIVYFSGHGYEFKSSVGRHYFLLPNGYDVNNLSGTAISGQELSDALRAIPARKLLLLLDCCHAGGLDDIKAPGKTFARAPLPAAEFDALAAGQGRQIIASSRAGEKSFGGRPWSAFTRALLEALCGQGASKDDGFVRVSDIAMHAAVRVPELTRKRQHPIHNYEAADNFKVAYYAAGDMTPKAPPFPAEPDIEPEPGAYKQVIQVTVTTYQGTADHGSSLAQGPGAMAVSGRGVINTGKVGGHIVTGDGNVVAGRDAAAGLTAEALDKLFAPILAAIAALPAAQQPAATVMAEDLQAEVAKEDKADDGRLARLIDGLISLAPGTVAGLVAAFAHPVLKGLAGPATQAILNSIR